MPANSRWYLIRRLRVKEQETHLILPEHDDDDDDDDDSIHGVQKGLGLVLGNTLQI